MDGAHSVSHFLQTFGFSCALPLQPVTTAHTFLYRYIRVFRFVLLVLPPSHMLSTFFIFPLRSRHFLAPVPSPALPLFVIKLLPNDTATKLGFSLLTLSAPLPSPARTQQRGARLRRLISLPGRQTFLLTTRRLSYPLQLHLSTAPSNDFPSSYSRRCRSSAEV